MEFRFKELIRYVIPGFYLLLQIGFVLAYNRWNTILAELSKDYFEGLIAIFVFLSPVVAYFIGYFIEAAASSMEYYMYSIDRIFKRPSYLILKGLSTRYQVKGIENIMTEIANEPQNNKDAKEIFDAAHQRVGGSELLNEFLFQSMVSRNLFCAQLLLWFCFIIFLIAKDCCLCEKIIEIAIYSIFTWFVYVRWVQRSMTYTKHVFIEYLKQCQHKNSTDTTPES